MEYWMTWLIVAAVGLVVGFIIHGIMRYALGPSLIVTLVLGIVGALLAVYYLTPVIMISPTSVVVTRYVWAIIGALVLSIIGELLFAPTRRGRVVTA